MVVATRNMSEFMMKWDIQAIVLLMLGVLAFMIVIFSLIASAGHFDFPEFSPVLISIVATLGAVARANGNKKD